MAANSFKKRNGVVNQNDIAEIVKSNIEFTQNMLDIIVKNTTGSKLDKLDAQVDKATDRLNRWSDDLLTILDEGSSFMKLIEICNNRFFLKPLINKKIYSNMSTYLKYVNKIVKKLSDISKTVVAIKNPKKVVENAEILLQLFDKIKQFNDSNLLQSTISQAIIATLELERQLIKKIGELAESIARLNLGDVLQNLRRMRFMLKAIRLIVTFNVLYDVKRHREVLTRKQLIENTKNIVIAAIYIGAMYVITKALESIVIRAIFLKQLRKTIYWYLRFIQSFVRSTFKIFNLFARRNIALFIKELAMLTALVTGMNFVSTLFVRTGQNAALLFAFKPFLVKGLRLMLQAVGWMIKIADKFRRRDLLILIKEMLMLNILVLGVSTASLFLIRVGQNMILIIALNKALTTGLKMLSKIVSLMFRVTDQFQRRKLMTAIKEAAIFNVLVIGMTIATSYLIELGLLTIMLYMVYPLVRLNLLMMGWIVRGFCRLSNILAKLGVKSLANFSIFAFIVAALTATAAALIILGILAIPVLMSIGRIFLLILALVVISLEIVLLSFGLIPLVLLSPFVFAGLAALVMSVTMILVVAAELAILQTINLDHKKIRENTRAVVKTALDIINQIFGATVGNPNKKDDSRFWRKIFRSFRATASGIIRAAGAAVILIATFISVSMILLIALMLSVLQKIKLNSGGILINVNIVMTTALAVIDSLYRDSNKKKNGKDKGWLRSFISTVFRSIRYAIQAIMTFSFVAITFLSIGIIWLIAKTLSNLQNIRLDKEKILSVVEDVFDAAEAITLSLRRDPGEVKKGKNLFGKLFNWAFPNLSSLLDAIMAFPYVLVTMVTVGMVRKIAETIEAIGKVNLGDLSRNKGKILDVLTHAQDLMDVVIYEAHFDDTGKVVIDKDRRERKEFKLQDWHVANFEKLASVVGSIGSIASTLSSFNYPGDEKLTDLQRIIVSLNEINNRIASDTKDAREGYDNLANFIAVIDKTDISKLEKAPSIFENILRVTAPLNKAMYDFYNVLDQKILPKLEEMQEIFENLPVAINNMSNDLSDTLNINAAESRGALTRSMLADTTSRKNPNMSKEQIESLISERLNNQARMNANSVESKLDELITLLRGNGSVRGIPVINI